MKNARKRKNARAAICKAKRATGSSGVFPLGAHFCFHAEALGLSARVVIERVIVLEWLP